MLHLLKIKTKGSDGDDIYLIDCPLLSNLINAFKHHLALSLLMPDDAPLFAWQTANGDWCPMTKAWFMDKCTEVWKRKG